MWRVGHALRKNRCPRGIYWAPYGVIAGLINKGQRLGWAGRRRSKVFRLDARDLHPPLASVGLTWPDTGREREREGNVGVLHVYRPQQLD